MLLHLLNNPSIVNKYDFSSVEAFHVGAAPVSQELADKIEHKFKIPVLLVCVVVGKQLLRYLRLI
jgi:hypothetical protein